MKDQLSRIEAKLDAVQVDIQDIKVLDATQNQQLAEHMRRTEALEKRFDSLPQRLLILTSILGGVVTLIKIVL